MAVQEVIFDCGGALSVAADVGEGAAPHLDASTPQARHDVGEVARPWR